MSGVKGAGSQKRMGGCLCRGHERVREGGADEEGSGKGGGARLARLPAGAVQKNGSGRGRQSVGGGEEPLLSRAALGHLRSRLRMPGPCPTRVHWRGRRQGARSLHPLQRPPAPQWVQTVGTPSRPGPRQKSGTRNNYTHIRAAWPEPTTVREAVEARYGSEPAPTRPGRLRRSSIRVRVLALSPGPHRSPTPAPWRIHDRLSPIDRRPRGNKPRVGLAPFQPAPRPPLAGRIPNSPAPRPTPWRGDGLRPCLRLISRIQSHPAHAQHARLLQLPNCSHCAAGGTTFRGARPAFSSASRACATRIYPAQPCTREHNRQRSRGHAPRRTR